MIYIAHPGTDVALHLAAEYYFATEKKMGQTVFMLWQSEPTLVVGRFQNIYEEVEHRYVKEKGIKIVRRMSGGGTVYQDGGGRQFAFIDYEGKDGIDFASYLAPIVQALQGMGVPAEINGRNDLTAQGKKFSGNAQYRKSGTTVHHGTLLFDTDIAEMVASTSPDPYKITSKSIKSVKDRVVNVSIYLPGMTADAFADTIAQAVMGKDGVAYHLTDEDHARIEQIANEIFRADEFLYGSNPTFDAVKTERFPGGRVEVGLHVEKNKIVACALHGDFFASTEPGVIENALVGVEYEKNAVLGALAPFDGMLMGIELEALAELVTR